MLPAMLSTATIPSPLATLLVSFLSSLPVITVPKEENGRREGDSSGKNFDYIVVGLGAAGAAVAARLSEDPTKVRNKCVC